ncbi:hypothetical protein [Nocardiopsis sp. CNT312]|uniref:hypothetical protein n=1 Tax=Nocardiopsis sp. CNT312 TaxID=1137268 RepID=UPI00048D1835|nr:hypothetical protein [Nocardiopsis sp. CNT312]
MLRELFRAFFGLPPGHRFGEELTRETLAFPARLPSSGQGLWFDAAFDLAVTWHRNQDGDHVRDRARLQSSLIREAARRSSGFALGDHGRAQAEVSCALNGGGGSEVEAVHHLSVRVALTAHEEDLALERQRQLVWHRAEVAREEHRVRMRRVRELLEEVLHDPLTARVWWFEQHQDRWNEIAAAGAALDLLSPRQVFTPGSGPVVQEDAEPGRDPVLDAFLSGLDDYQKAPVVQNLTELLEAFERRDLAERLRQRWAEA